MSFLALTVDTESDSAAFADRTCCTYRGVSEGLPRLVDFFGKQGYPVTLFVSCEALPKLDADLIMKPNIEVASHGCGHTFPPKYLTGLSFGDLQREIAQSQVLLKGIFGVDVIGFRAHGLIVNPQILELLSKYYVYDSSVILYRKYNGKTLTMGSAYHPSKHSVVEAGDFSITELPVCSKKLGFLNVPFIGSYIRLFPESLFRRTDDSLVIIDLHTQDAVRFRGWRHLFVDKYFSRLQHIVDHYENRGYKLSLMKEIAEHEIVDAN